MPTTGNQEIVHSLGELKSETSAALASLQVKVDGINRRLDVSNGRIAQHDQTIQELRINEARILMQLQQSGSDRSERQANRRRFGLALFERLVWLVAAIILALVVHYAHL